MTSFAKIALSHAALGGSMVVLVACTSSSQQGSDVFGDNGAGGGTSGAAASTGGALPAAGGGAGLGGAMSGTGGTAVGGAPVGSGGVSQGAGGGSQQAGGASPATGGRSGRGGAAGFGGSAGAASGSGGASGSTGTGGAAGACTPNTACMPSAPATGDIYADCVARVNQFRACVCLPPLQRWMDGEACANQDASYDAQNQSMGAHAAFKAKICAAGNAQDECPGWRSNDQVISGCLQQMFNEGPPPSNPCSGTCYEQHGHYINMTNTRYTMVACGYYTGSDGKVWAVQNFK